MGDLLAVKYRNPSWGGDPQIEYNFLAVDRLTKTQAVCGDARFRLSDGARIGSDSYFKRAVPVTPQMIENRAAQVAELKRYRAAKTRIERLEDHAVVEIRKLRTEQIEALADAWERILAM